MSSSSITKLKHLLLHLSLQTNTATHHLHRLLSTPHGTDTLLSTTYYTLALAHSQLTHHLARKYTDLAEAIARNASRTMLPGETFIAEIEAPHPTLRNTAASLRSLGDAVQDFRLVARLWGLVHVYVAAQRAWRAPRRDPAVKALGWLKMGADVGFLGCENLAYLTRRGVLRGEGCVRREGRWWVWSARFWGVQVGLEFLRLFRVRQLRFNEELGAEEVGVRDEKVVRVQSRELEEKWWRDLYANLGWLPWSVHWSLYDQERSPVSEAMIGIGGMVSGIVRLKEAWKETA
jgi:hypothetical protein